MKMIKDAEERYEENCNRYTRISYTVGHYDVYVDDSVYADGSTRRSISAVAISNPYEDGRYLPSIYYDVDVFGRKAPDFKIQTTSYGSLNADEFQKFIAAQNEALEVVATLKKELL